MSAMLQDIKYGVRRLVKQPGFTAVAVLTLALGIGANTAIFSAVRAVLLQTLPVRDPEKLMFFTESTSEGTLSGDPVSGEWELFSYPLYQVYKSQLSVLEDLAAFRSGESQLSVIGESGTSGGQAQIASSHLVTGNFFSVLGAEPILGRALTPDDDRPGSPPVGVLSHGYWQSRFGSDPLAIGRTVSANGIPLTIVGVMGPEFFGIRVRNAPNYWLPMQLQPRVEFRDSMLADPSVYWLNMVGRLRANATLAEAQQAADAILRQHLTDLAGSEITPDRSEGIAESYVKLAGGGRGISRFRAQYANSLYVLGAGVALILLIACANIANLLLARGTARQGEIAVRLALGASTRRLTQQLVTEGVLLAAAGGAVGLLFADWGVHLLVRIVAQDAPLKVSVNPGILGFTAVISLVAGILFSLAPAWRSSRLDVGSALKERSQGAGGGAGRWSLAPSLVAAQVAFSLILLVGAGLLTRSLVMLQGQDLGFERQGVVLARIMPRLAGYTAPDLPQLYRTLMDRLNGLPGVTFVSMSTFSPLSGNSRTANVSVPGYTPAEGENLITNLNLVGPSYHQTLGMQLLLGREINEQDGSGAPLVAMINQTFAGHFFPAQNPIGRTLRFGAESAGGPLYEIVGVLGDTRFEAVTEAPGMMVYTAILQSQERSAFSSELHLRVSGDPAATIEQVRTTIAEVDPELPIYRISSLDEQMQSTLRGSRILARLVAGFGCLAVLLACVGLYGVVSQSVNRRTHELGIRMALGADRSRIVGMVLGETMRLIAAGLAIGIPAALGAGYLIRHQLYGVDAQDPLTLAGTSLFLLLVALGAGYIPAWRASRVDPMVALRKE